MIGERIAKLRKGAGLTQKELSEMLNVSASAIGMYEQGRRIPSQQKLKEICDHFEVSADWLLNGKENQRPLDDFKKFELMVDRVQNLLWEDKISIKNSEGAVRWFTKEEVLLLCQALLSAERTYENPGVKSPQEYNQSKE